MYWPVREKNKETLEDYYGRPVESIMKCQGFKSNFARKLSNRHIAKSPAVFRHENVEFKQLESVNTQESANTGAAVIGDQKNRQVNNAKQGGATTGTPGKMADMLRTEVAALNREVETLRWQLAQTEANRQMNVVLLKQVVCFLNRVKEHMEGQQQGSKKDDQSPRSPDHRDLPRSLSLLTVDNSWNAGPAKKKNVVKPNSNVPSGSRAENKRDNRNIRNQSRLSLIPENDATKQIVEEIMRLITLANTILNTKLPDLACGSGEASIIVEFNTVKKGNEQNVTESKNIHKHEGNASASREASVCEDKFEDSLNWTTWEPTLSGGSEGAFATKPRVEGVQSPKPRPPPVRFVFAEDESGFSSMNSYQEIGIPIINIIPPTPVVEQESGMGDNEKQEDDKWRPEEPEMEYNTVRVYWV